MENGILNKLRLDLNDMAFKTDQGIGHAYFRNAANYDSFTKLNRYETTLERSLYRAFIAAQTHGHTRRWWQSLTTYETEGIPPKIRDISFRLGGIALLLEIQRNGPPLTFNAGNHPYGIGYIIEKLDRRVWHIAYDLETGNIKKQGDPA